MLSEHDACSSSRDQEPAIDGKRVPGGERCTLRTQPYDCIGNLFWSTNSPEGMQTGDSGSDRGIVKERALCHRRMDHGGCWKVSRLGTLENFVDEAGGSAPMPLKRRQVRHESTGGHILAATVHRWHLSTQRCLDDPVTVRKEHRVADDHKCASARTGDGSVQLSRLPRRLSDRVEGPALAPGAPSHRRRIGSQDWRRSSARLPS